MSSYITLYKLDAVRKSLVSDRYSEKNEAIYSKISNMVYDLVYSKIPKSIKIMFEDLESDYINSKTDPDHTPNLPEYSGITNFFNGSSKSIGLQIELETQNVELETSTLFGKGIIE